MAFENYDQASHGFLGFPKRIPRACCFYYLIHKLDFRESGRTRPSSIFENGHKQKNNFPIYPPSVAIQYDSVQLVVLLCATADYVVLLLRATQY